MTDQYEYAITYESPSDRYTHCFGVPPPKGDGWEFAAFSCAAGGDSRDLTPCAVVLWRRRLTP